MRNMLSLVGLLVVLFLGLGWYLDWYQVHPVATSSDPGQKTYTIEVNTQKVEKDGEKGVRAVEDRLHDLFDQASERVKGAAEKKPAGGSKANQTAGDTETSEPGRAGSAR